MPRSGEQTPPDADERQGDAAYDQERPLPDEAPTPQPERHEPKVEDAGVQELSKRDYWAVAKRAVRESIDDQITDLAAALAYYSFLAMPSVLLVAVGVFTLFAGPDAITTLIDKLGTVVPSEVTKLVENSLRRLNSNQSASIWLTVVGFVLAIWSSTSAMTALMRALNRAYDRDETRGFAKQRLTALMMLAAIGIAFILVFGLLVLGPSISHWIADAVGSWVTWTWWVAQWPILVFGLLAAFAVVLYLGPNVDHPRWSLLSIGAVLALVVWLAASAGFAFYTSAFGSYNKTWGALAAVIIMLTWLWLSGLAILFGAELNAELERSRELRQGEDAEVDLQAPDRG
jgi:membrane protein